MKGDLEAVAVEERAIALACGFERRTWLGRAAGSDENPLADCSRVRDVGTVYFGRSKRVGGV
jgi:hypothetical protein